MNGPCPRHTRKRSPPRSRSGAITLQRAEFEPFPRLDRAGRVRFEGPRPTAAKRFRDRVWPVFWRIRPPWQTTDAWELRATPMFAVAYNRSLHKASRLMPAPRLLVTSPTQRQGDRVEATRGTRA